MADSQSINGEFPTIIGADAVIKGELSFEKGVRLLGKFDGEITTKGNLVVADGAVLSGEVKAGSVQIDGQMSGNLEATGKVKLAASAKLEGDLRTARLEVADGATFIGKCSVGPNNGKATSGGGSSSGSAPADKPKGGSQNQAVAAGKR
ncbi:MAG: polymer-forming cytoskeletal protein [Phycisphaerales bacterium]|nr:polymer-forming cytoskeletal protein [Phycisphaerales bacterium]